MGLLPLLAALIYRPPKPYWILSAAFGVSWLGDWMSGIMGVELAVYLWLPIQIGMVLWALVATTTGRRLILVGVPLLTLASAMYTAPSPELVLTVIGSVAILHLADGPVAIPLYLYFGLGTVAYLLMIRQARDGDPTEAWYLYQACRLAAYVAFAFLLRGRRRWAT